MSARYRLVLLRHGESTWNDENRFTGWYDCPLSKKGEIQAIVGGRLLVEHNMKFDFMFTSYLKRAIKTLWHVMEETDQMYLPVQTAWELNERHYGDLEGKNKNATAEEVGEEQVHQWRRSYDTAPPPCPVTSVYHPSNDHRYAKYPNAQSIATESLKNTLERVLPYWQSDIVSKILAGKRVLIVAHGNSLRALVKHLDHISDEEIPSVNIPLGIPLVYDLDEQLQPIESFAGEEKESTKVKAAPLRGYYLATKDEATKRVNEML